jgi:hypothetical protein
VPRAEFFKQVALTRRLPQMKDDIKSLKERITRLEQQFLDKQYGES